LVHLGAQLTLSQHAYEGVYVLGRFGGALHDPRRSARTLELTDEHLRDYPRGAFSEEREVLAIEALVRTGEKERARARMQRFASGFPNSTHITRIRALLE